MSFLLRQKRRKRNRWSKYPWAISVRITDNLDTFLLRAAKKKGISQSELIRQILRKALREGKYV
jgi:predicted HicB family RNase H-like nuclease